MRVIAVACLLTICTCVNARGRLAPADSRPCADECAAAACADIGIRWGKYCGVTHTGCPGASPCDSYDSCCKTHDACVTGGGLSASDQRCHSDFIACLEAAFAAKAPTWSGACSAKQIVSTMTNGIRMASAFSSMLSSAGAGAGGAGAPRRRREL